MTLTKLWTAIFAVTLTASATAAAANPYSFRHSAPGIKAADTPATPTPPVTPPSSVTFDSNTALNVVLSSNKLTVSKGPQANYGNVLGSMGKSSGKWYWEVTVNADAPSVGMGICPLGTYIASGNWPLNNGCVTLWSNGLYVSTNYVRSAPVSFTGGAVFGFALDMDAKTFNVYRNNSPVYPSGHLWTGVSATAMVPVVSLYSQAQGSLTANFGATPFKYAPPAGYSAGIF